jgi:hypothetical protein
MDAAMTQKGAPGESHREREREREREGGRHGAWSDASLLTMMMYPYQCMDGMVWWT